MHSFLEGLTKFPPCAVQLEGLCSRVLSADAPTPSRRRHLYVCEWRAVDPADGASESPSSLLLGCAERLHGAGAPMPAAACHVLAGCNATVAVAALEAAVALLRAQAGTVALVVPLWLAVPRAGSALYATF